ncbi:MAG TPA: Trk system potassium transporter TrkA [candidate division Zixibacteria bacterium]|nr:Trk system potassium transporter TrkA [candidate division Zixibacteria bacterium]
MRIVIVGGGVVGYSLADHLLRDKHHLSLVELDANLCREISEKLDLQIINGSGSSPAVLHEAGLPEADMVLAVTPNDEVNMVVCAIAAQYEVPRRIARIRNREFNNDSASLSKIGITSVIHPEKVLVDNILQFVETPHAVESADFEEGRILLRGYRVRENMEIAGKTPLQIRQEINPHIVLFAALVRAGEGMIPDGSTEILPGDIVYSLFPRESLPRFLQMMGFEHKKRRKIVVSGDSYATAELALALDKTDNNVILVDPNLKHAEEIAAQFETVQVIHGDCTQADILREINIESASFFIASSNAAEYNMLSTLLAKVEGAHEVIATTTDNQHDALFHSIGIDHVLNPRLTTAREILEIISRGQIGAVVRLHDVDIEAVRFNVSPTSDVAGMQIRKLASKLKRGSIVGIIVRQDRMILPGGDTVIEADDHVIMITRHKNLGAISKLFKARG